MVAEPAPQAQIQIPLGAVTRADIGRLAKEAEAIDNFLQNASVRQPGTAVQLPKTSNLFDELVNTNRINLLQAADRQYLLKFLEELRVKAPTIHISFSTDPSSSFQVQLITWIRQQLHPYMLLRIGLQPSIGAGCMVRSTNKVFDFSLRQRFTDKKSALVELLHAGSPQQVAPLPTEPVAEPSEAAKVTS